MVRRWMVVVVLAGCASEPRGPDVTGPFTGTPRRFVVDALTVPKSNAEARALGADLDGDDHVDNQLGAVLGTLAD